MMGRNNCRKCEIFHFVSVPNQSIGSVSRGARSPSIHQWWQRQEGPSYQGAWSPNGAWFGPSPLTASAQGVAPTACEPLHLIAGESGVIFPQLALAPSDSHSFPGSYRNRRRHFSPCAEGSARQGGSGEGQRPIKLSASSPGNL